MRVSSLFLLLIGTALTMSSCKDKTPEPEPEPVDMVRISVQPVYGSEELYLDSGYTTIEGYKVKFTDIKFYVHDVRNNGVQMIESGLFDFRQRGTLLLEAEGKASSFDALQANLGVGASANHSDPTAFSNESMLNISNSNDMHWDWNPGYIFVKIEGKADTIPDATETFDHTIVLHAGLDVNLQTIDWTGLQWNTVSDKLSELQLELDMATFLNSSTQTIDLKTENATHSMAGQEALTLKVMENFKEALSPM
jgi:hypothetical protein